ncbi:MAG: hydrogenase [Pseudomonadota bacterium]
MFSQAIKNMQEREGYPSLAGPELDAFIESHDDVVLVFAEAMKPIPEADDLAVIFPELMKAYPEKFAVAVVPFPAHREMKLRYHFLKIPTLVFLRGGEYVGAITGIRDWGDYLEDIRLILAAEPTEPPPMFAPDDNATASAH